MLFFLLICMREELNIKIKRDKNQLSFTDDEYEMVKLQLKLKYS